MTQIFDLLHSVQSYASTRFVKELADRTDLNKVVFVGLDGSGKRPSS
jgi:hypothetical protein